MGKAFEENEFTHNLGLDQKSQTCALNAHIQGALFGESILQKTLVDIM